MSEVKITYETLFDLLRREKNRNELQSLDETFYADVIDYLKTKRQALKDSDEKKTYSQPEREKIRIQIKNIKKILKELYEIREQKTLFLAMDKVRTESQLIDTTSLLAEEKKFFNETTTILKKYKEGVLQQIVRGKPPLIDTDTDYSQPTTKLPKQVEKKPAKEEVEETSKPQEIKKGDIEIIITSKLPKFVGLDKEIYGPFDKGSTAKLPAKVAKLLINKGRAKEK